MKKKKPLYSFDHTTGEGQKRLFYESRGLPYEPKTIDVLAPGDYGCDPLPDGRFKMVPSGDIVNAEEKERRLKKFRR